MTKDHTHVSVFADLHNHTTASDGTRSPAELIEKAAFLGIRAVGVTDHDTLKGLPEALTAGIQQGIEVVSGVEISIRFKRPGFVGTLHLLYYFTAARFSDPSFVRELNRVLSGGRGEALVRARIHEINRWFGPGSNAPILGRDMGYEDIAELSDNATRRHFALALKNGFGIQDPLVINRILGNESPAYLPSGIDLRAVAPILGHPGTLSVLAHPAAGSFPGGGHYREVLPPLETVLERLPEFLNAGIQGLEVYYPGHTKAHQEELKALARRHGLLITGGSDCHDDRERPLGAAGLSEAEYKAFKERLI